MVIDYISIKGELMGRYFYILLTKVIRVSPCKWLIEVI